MRVLFIGTGNCLRRDDGVAHAVLELLNGDWETRPLAQLTPELSEDIAGYERVIFVDADASAADLSIEAVDESRSLPVLTHVSSPAEIVELSRALFGFSGQAFVCRIPVADLSSGEGLSPRARMYAAQAAGDLEHMMENP